MDNKVVLEFIARKHDYILRRRESLNEMTFKIFSIYQVVLASLAAAQFSVFKEQSKAVISHDIARVSSAAIMVFFLIATLGYVSLSLGGIFAWLNYRVEEAQLEREVGAPPRALPAKVDIFKWYEFYLLVLVVVVSVCVSAWYLMWAFPYLNSLA